MSERYRILEPIGAGGMGTLWRAHHVELGVDVALKVVATHAASAATLRRFKREARAAARLQSPNVVKVFDYGEFEGQPYLAMELLRGEDLARRLARTGKLTPEGCMAIMEGIIKAVQAAHDAGIVHRDLKPANVFLEQVGDEEVAKVLDFGVAKDLRANDESTGTPAEDAVGSPAYMSPEQVWGQDVGRRADIWALGVIAFESLTGKNPFAAATLGLTFERIIREPLPEIGDFSADLPVALGPFFRRALARSPEERFASAPDLGGALRAALGEKTPSLAAGRERKPSARPTLGLVLVGVALAIALAQFLAHRASPPPEPRSVATSAVPPVAAAPLEPPHQRALATSAQPTAAPPSPRSSSTTPILPRNDATRTTPRIPDRARQEPELDPRFGIPRSSGR